MINIHDDRDLSWPFDWLPFDKCLNYLVHDYECCSRLVPVCQSICQFFSSSELGPCHLPQSAWRCYSW